MDAFELLQPLLSEHGELRCTSTSIDQLHTECGLPRSITSAVRIETQIEGREIVLVVGIERFFPFVLPKAYLFPPDALGRIPHVIYNGSICYMQSEGIVPDITNPSGILCESLLKACSTLRDGIRGDNTNDYVEELSAYWQYDDIVLSFIDCPKTVTILEAGRGKQGYIFIASNQETVRQYLNSAELAQHTFRRALYIPLTHLPLSMPPFGASGWSSELVRQLVSEAVETDNRATLLDIANKYSNIDLFVFSIPQPAGKSVLFGLLAVGVSPAMWLFGTATAREIIPVGISPFSADYLFARGGSDQTLQAKKVAVIGAGSVGGFIVNQLAHAGVCNITVIDPDKVLPENTFRHRLGKEYWWEAKVAGLKKEVERNLPYVQITPICETFQQAFSRPDFDLSSFDLLIVAIGDPKTELFLNNLIHTTADTPPTVFTWLEAYGIGGHAILVHNPRASSPCCLQCLYTPMPDDVEGIFACRAAFADPDQSFTKTLAGCAARFTPYGSLDAQRTAELATRLAVEYLSGRLHTNPLRYWRGDDTLFREEGYRTSTRYQLSDDMLASQECRYANPACPICGKMS